MTQEPEQPIAVPKSWIEVDQVEVFAANEFVISHDPNSGEFYLTVGHVTPPIILGTDEEQREQAERLVFVPVRTVGRFSLSRLRVEQLMTVLQTNLARYDERRKGTGNE